MASSLPRTRSGQPRRRARQLSGRLRQAPAGIIAALHRLTLGHPPPITDEPDTGTTGSADRTARDLSMPCLTWDIRSTLRAHDGGSCRAGTGSTPALGHAACAPAACGSAARTAAARS